MDQYGLCAQGLCGEVIFFNQDQDQDQGRLPGGRLFRLRRVTWKSTPSNQGCLLLVGLLLRRSTLTPTTLRGPAPNGHPCPDGALAASMRLGPLRVVCVRPAPKSRSAVSGLFVFEDQKRLVGPALAGKPLILIVPTLCVLIVPTLCVGMHPLTLRVTGLTDATRAVSGTGFSREEASLDDINLAV